MAVAAAVMVAAAAAAVAVMAAAAAAGVTWVALTWAAARVVVMSAALAVVASAAVTSAVVGRGRFFFGGCVGCGGCGGCGGCSGDTCWIWTPGGWIYSCGAEFVPASRVAKQIEPKAEAAKTVDGGSASRELSDDVRSGHRSARSR